MILQIGLLIFNNANSLDITGPYEVFSTVLLENYVRPFNIKTIAETKELITTNSGLVIKPELTFADKVRFDIIIIPGGPGRREEVTNQKVINWIKDQAQRVELVASVCTGAFLLAEAGLLASKKATTHWQAIEELQHKYPEVEVVEQRRFIDQGNVLTSAGVSSGITMSLHMVEKLLTKKVAKETAKQIEYKY